jgi:16S rRNA processing protein RimM
MEKIQFSSLGKIVKTFGYKGELIATIEERFCKQLNKMEFVFVEIQHERVPFFVVSVENQYNNTFLLVLEDIDSIEKARELSGSTLFIAETGKTKKTSREFNLKDLIGFEVTDEKFGVVGKIHQILELPQQHIMQLFNNKKEILIPFNEDFVLRIDAQHKTIKIKAPEGLIDFYME